MSILDPPLPQRTRTAAVQPVTQPPTAGIVQRRSQTTADRETVDQLFRKQTSAALLANAPPASYPVQKVQTTIAQVEPILQRRDGTQWIDVDDPELTPLIDEFRWDSLQLDLKDIAGMMAYHRMVTGEHVVVCVSTGETMDYRVYPVQACAFNKPVKGQVTVKEAANGNVRQGTAYVVPRDVVTRCWAPHPSYPAQAWSPILSGIEPLELCSSLSKLMRAHSDSRAVAGGGKALIYPDEWAEGMDDQGRDVDKVAQAVAEFGMLAADHTDLRRLLPLMLHGRITNESKPFMLDLVQPFEPKLIDWWNASLQRFSQAMNLSGLTVTAGGVGEMNHWSEWKASEENWKDAFAPFADAVYDDITRLFLHGTYRDRLDATDITQYRVWYDPATVIIPPDKKQSARELEDDGVLRGKAAAKVAGFDDEDLLVEPEWDRQEERDWYLARKSAGKIQHAGEIPTSETIRKQEGGPTTGGPEGQTPTPPTGPGGNGQTLPTPPTPATSPPNGRAAAVGPNPAAQRVIGRLQRLRRDTGRKLQQRAADAVGSAVRAATARVAGQVGNAKPGTRVAALARNLGDLDARRSRFREHGVGKAMLAALGLTEEELLADEMGVYIDETGSDLETYMRKRRDIIEAEGFDPDLGGTTSHAAEAAVFLGATAIAIARSSLTDGVAPPTPGEFSGVVPFSVVRDALSVAAGTATSTIPGSPDDKPTATPNGDLDAEFGIADQLGMQVVYTWVHGASGEPDNPYEPHVEMDGYELRDAETNDDGTAVSDVGSPDDWTDGDTLYPGDHNGCTCDWDVELVEPEGGTSLSPAPGEASLT